MIIGNHNHINYLPSANELPQKIYCKILLIAALLQETVQIFGKSHLHLTCNSSFAVKMQMVFAVQGNVSLTSCTQLKLNRVRMRILYIHK